MSNNLLENKHVPNLEINKKLDMNSNKPLKSQPLWYNNALENAVANPKIQFLSIMLYKKTSDGSELAMYANDMTRYKSIDAICIYPINRPLSYKFNRSNNIFTVLLPTELQNKTLILNIIVKKPNNVKIHYKASYSP
jgi:hypothetical protein